MKRYMLFTKQSLTIGLILLLSAVFVAAGVSQRVQTIQAAKTQERKLPVYCVDTAEKKVAITFDAAWGAEDTDLQAYYTALCHMKNTLAVLKNGDVRVTEAGGGRIAFTRSDGNTTATIYVNQSEKPWIVGGGAMAFGCNTDFDGAAYTIQKDGFCILLTRQ